MKVIREQKVTRGHWKIKENVLEEARKYKDKASWNKSGSSAKRAACRYGWYEEATAHMIGVKVLRKNYVTIQMEEIEKAGIPQDSPVGKRFNTMCKTFWTRHRMNITAKEFLALIKITEPNGKGAIAFDPISKVWLDILEASVHTHHCINGKIILFFTQRQRNVSMGHLGDTPLSFIELTHVLVSAGAKIPKDKLDEAKELLRKLNEAVNKMDSGLCDIVS